MSLIFDVVFDGNKLKAALYQAGAPVQSFEEIQVSMPVIRECARRMIDMMDRQSRDRVESPGAYKELCRSGQILFDFLVPASMKSTLADSSRQSLLIVMDESLVFVPWELLFASGEFLCRRFFLGRCVRRSRASRKDLRQNPVETFKMLIIADPEGDLPQAREEAMDIRRIMSDVNGLHVISKTRHVTRHYFLQHIRDCRILHYAGHALSNPEEQIQSGWKMSDGLVSVQDFCRLGENATFPELIYMNACRSADVREGKNHANREEGLYGLADALLMAGGRYVIGTLSMIADKSAARLAAIFYQQLSLKHTIGQALMEARCQLARESPEDQLAWAGYVFYGDPDGSIFETNPQGAATAGLKTIQQRSLGMSYLRKTGITVLGLAIACAGIIYGQGQIDHWTAKRHFTSGNYHEAFLYYQRIIGENEDDVHALLGLVQSLMRMELYPDAVRELERFCGKFDERLSQGDFPFETAQLAFQLERYALAYKLFIYWAKPKRLDPSDYLRAYTAAAHAASLGRAYQEADELFIKALYLAGEISPVGKQIELILARADNALEGYLDEQGNSPVDAQVQWTLAQAKDYYEKALELSTKENIRDLSARARSSLGKVLQWQGQSHMAAQSYRAALKEWEAVNRLSSDQSFQRLGVFLDLGEIIVESRKDFSEVFSILQSFERSFREELKSGQLPDPARMLLMRKMESLLREMIRKGYKNSELYRKSGNLYDQLSQLK